MRSSKIILSILSILGPCALTQRVSSQSLAQSKRIVIAASAVLDGKGHVLHDTRIVIDGPKIIAIDPKAGPVDYDLRGLTVLPGWIDVHVHIGWFFGKDGKLAGAAKCGGPMKVIERLTAAEIQLRSPPRISSAA